MLFCNLVSLLQVVASTTVDGALSNVQGHIVLLAGTTPIIYTNISVYTGSILYTGQYRVVYSSTGQYTLVSNSSVYTG